MNTFAERLSYALAERKLKQADIVKAGIASKGTVSNWYSGKNNPNDAMVMAKLAKLLKVSSEWLTTGEGSMIETFDPAQQFISELRANDTVQVDYGEDDNFISIPVYDVIFCCGDGNNATYDFEEVKGERKFPPHFFEKRGVKPENFKLLCARNDSMSPYINDKDEVGINLADTEVREGEVYAILLDDERMFKQIFREGNGILRLHSFNANYPDKLIDRSNGKSLKIVGRQIYRAG